MFRPFLVCVSTILPAMPREWQCSCCWFRVRLCTISMKKSTCIFKPMKSDFKYHLEGRASESKQELNQCQDQYIASLRFKDLMVRKELWCLLMVWRLVSNLSLFSSLGFDVCIFERKLWLSFLFVCSTAVLPMGKLALLDTAYVDDQQFARITLLAKVSSNSVTLGFVSLAIRIRYSRRKAEKTRSDLKHRIGNRRSLCPTHAVWPHVIHCVLGLHVCSKWLERSSFSRFFSWLFYA